MPRVMHIHDGLGDQSGYSWPPTLGFARCFAAHKPPNLLGQFLPANGRTPHFGDGNEPALLREAMAATLNAAVEDIKRIQHEARIDGSTVRPRWTMNRNWERGAPHG
jgi:hypothetical protein